MAWTWGRPALLAAVKLALPWPLVARAHRHGTTGAVTIGTASMPSWTDAFSTFALRLEPSSRARPLDLALGLGRVIVLVGDDLRRGNEGSAASR